MNLRRLPTCLVLAQFALAACSASPPAPARCVTLVIVQGATVVGEPSTGEPTSGRCTVQDRGGHTYWFCDVLRNRDDARDACRQLGADLVRIDDPEEEAFLEPAARSAMVTSVNGVWAGASDAASEGRWVWTDGTAVDYAPWLPHEPNNAGPNGEGCLEFHAHGGGWNDVPCSFQRPFVCEAVR